MAANASACLSWYKQLDQVRVDVPCSRILQLKSTYHPHSACHSHVFGLAQLLEDVATAKPHPRSLSLRFLHLSSRNTVLKEPEWVHTRMDGGSMLTRDCSGSTARALN